MVQELVFNFKIIDWKHYVMMFPVFLFFSCSLKPVKKLEAIGDFSFQDFILVNVRINDTLSGKMIFDTGSNHTILYKNFKDLLKVKKTKNSKITDFYNNSAEIEYGNIKKIAFGKINLNNTKIRFYNFNSLYGSNDIIGILGTDIIKQFTWFFDFSTKKILINNFSYLNDSSLNELSVNFNNSSFVKNTFYINQFKIDDFILDTGCLCQISLNENTRPKMIYNTEISLESSLVGKEEEFIIDYTNLSEVKYNFTVSDSVQVITSKKFKNIIGLDLFKKDVLVIDGIANKFYYKKLIKHKSFLKNNIGLKLGLRNDILIVKTIIKDSTAFKKGLKLGDVIYSINNKGIKGSKHFLDSINNNRDDIKEIKVYRDKKILNFEFK